MDTMKISPTKSTPEIYLSKGGIISIKGRSINENIIDFFKPVELWINDYIKEPADLTNIGIELEYFNSASAKILIKLLQKLSYVELKHKKLKINWYYEAGDQDILEKGEYFSSVLKIPFNFIETD